MYNQNVKMYNETAKMYNETPKLYNQTLFPQGIHKVQAVR